MTTKPDLKTFVRNYLGVKELNPHQEILLDQFKLMFEKHKKVIMVYHMPRLSGRKLIKEAVEKFYGEQNDGKRK